MLCLYFLLRHKIEKSLKIWPELNLSELKISRELIFTNTLKIHEIRKNQFPRKGVVSGRKLIWDM